VGSLLNAERMCKVQTPRTELLQESRQQVYKGTEQAALSWSKKLLRLRVPLQRLRACTPQAELVPVYRGGNGLFCA
jgi:hypothetical protein